MMNLGRSENVGLDQMKVFSLLSDYQDQRDPLEDLLAEAGEQEMVKNHFLLDKKIVSNEHSTDQSMYILEGQLKNLKSTLSRIKFYISDFEDLFPESMNDV
jgi:hypothetical protein